MKFRKILKIPFNRGRKVRGLKSEPEGRRRRPPAVRLERASD